MESLVNDLLKKVPSNAIESLSELTDEEIEREFRVRNNRTVVANKTQEAVENLQRAQMLAIADYLETMKLLHIDLNEPLEKQKPTFDIFKQLFTDSVEEIFEAYWEDKSNFIAMIDSAGEEVEARVLNPESNQYE